MASSMRPNRPGPKAESAITAAHSTTAPLTSGDLATWPFSRASLTFFGVAFSVLLPPSAI